MKPRPLGFEIHAATSDDLTRALRATDISVPPRNNGRWSHHRERWAAFRLLATLTKAQRLAFPLSAMKRERPDLLLSMRDRLTGVEITEATSEQFEEFRGLAAREFPDVFYEPAHFRWGAPTRTVDEMRGLLRQTRLTSRGWSGDAPEREWALFVQAAVDAKLTKLADPNFAKFDRNWLSIYDNAPLPPIHLDEAMAHLEPLLADRWSLTPSFDNVFIEHGSVIVRMMASEHEVLPLHDLWTTASAGDRAPLGDESNDR